MWRRRHLLHDRDARFCAAFDAIPDRVGIKAMMLPPRSPNLNAYCERWVKSVKSEVVSKMILFGEGSLRHCLEKYVAHFHTERNHQGKENVILFPGPRDRIGESSGEIRTRERLGGLRDSTAVKPHELFDDRTAKHAGHRIEVWFDDVVVATEYIGPIQK